MKRSPGPPVPALPREAFRASQGERTQMGRLSSVNGHGPEEKGRKSKKECSRNKTVQATPSGPKHQCQECQCEGTVSHKQCRQGPQGGRSRLRQERRWRPSTDPWGGFSQGQSASPGGRGQRGAGGAVTEPAGSFQLCRACAKHVSARVLESAKIWYTGILASFLSPQLEEESVTGFMANLVSSYFEADS